MASCHVQWGINDCDIKQCEFAGVLNAPVESTAKSGSALLALEHAALLCVRRVGHPFQYDASG